MERERGWLTLADPLRQGREQLVTRYLSGWRAPIPPPLIRQVGALDDVPPARMSLRQQAWLAEFSTRAGALQATPAELTALLEQVLRTAGLGIIHLTLQIPATAAPGARSLFIQNTNLDKTAASGVLEVN